MDDGLCAQDGTISGDRNGVVKADQLWMWACACIHCASRSGRAMRPSWRKMVEQRLRCRILTSSCEGKMSSLAGVRLFD